MKILVINTKGGCGKSLIAREIVAAPIAATTAIIEIDHLNKTQLNYENSFKAVFNFNSNSIVEVFQYMHLYENCVIDVGVGDIETTYKSIIELGIIEDIDVVVIPLNRSRSDAECAMKTYHRMSKHVKKIIFAFTNYDDDESLESNFDVFFKNVGKFGIEITKENHVAIPKSDIYLYAQERKELVLEIANQGDIKSAALAAREQKDMSKFKKLMERELKKRAAKITVDNVIQPAHKKIVGDL